MSGAQPSLWIGSTSRAVSFGLQGFPQIHKFGSGGVVAINTATVPSNFQALDYVAPCTGLGWHMGLGWQE